jgi:sterol desaturase/sphingolipid hydroxylase (fatty acid hydroxylase superfamily)
MRLRGSQAAASGQQIPEDSTFRLGLGETQTKTSRLSDWFTGNRHCSVLNCFLDFCPKKRSVRKELVFGWERHRGGVGPWRRGVAQTVKNSPSCLQTKVLLRWCPYLRGLSTFANSAGINMSVSRICTAGKASLCMFSVLAFLLFVLSNTISAVVRSLWTGITNNWFYCYCWLLERMSGTTLAIFGTAVVQLILYWSLSGFFWYMDLYRPTLFHRWKVQPSQRPSAADYLKCAKQVLFNQFAVAAPMLVLQHYLMIWRTDGSYILAEAWPSFWTFFCDILLILLVEEIVFYYFHRLAHHPYLYKHIHKRHHEFTSPVGMAATYAHPLEHFFCNLAPVHLGPLLCGSHLSTASVWYVIAVMSTINTHSGYHLPFLPSPEAHDFHHFAFGNNFGMLGILDWFHGTDIEFRASKKFADHMVNLSFAPLPRLK